MPGPDLEAALKDILELLLLFLSYLKHPSTHIFPREAGAAHSSKSQRCPGPGAGGGGTLEPYSWTQGIFRLCRDSQTPRPKQPGCAESLDVTFLKRQPVCFQAPPPQAGLWEVLNNPSFAAFPNALRPSVNNSALSHLERLLGYYRFGKCRR